jgi:putative phosphoesterase
MKGVFGNNDGDRITLNKFFKGIAEIMPGWIKIEHNGKIIYLTHRPLPAAPPDCDLYVFGHTHEPVVEKNEKSLIINPGECSGWLSHKSTVALVDLDNKEAELVEI